MAAEEEAPVAAGIVRQTKDPTAGTHGLVELITCSPIISMHR